MNKFIELITEPSVAILLIIIATTLGIAFMFYQSEKTERFAIEKGCEKIFVPNTVQYYWGNCKK